MVSIIVPVFNSRQFLEAAINSVVSRSFKDWELILIDDGSTDGSGKICDETAAKYGNVKVIHKPNGGLSSARNAGLDIAKGDFIFFLDADDLLLPHSLSFLSDLQKKTDADIVCGSFVKFDDKDEKDIRESWSKASHESFITYDAILAVKQVLYQKNIDNSAWGKLYRRSLWQGLRFREGINYEDLDIFYKVFLRASKIVFTPATVYLYRQHPSSYLHNFNFKRLDVLEVTERMVGFMERNYPALLAAARSRQLSANFNMFALLSSNGKKLDPHRAKKEADRCWNIIKDLRGEMLYNPSVRLKNKVAILLSYIGGRNLLKFLSSLPFLTNTR